MKYLIQILVLVSFISFTPPAEATGTQVKCGIVCKIGRWIRNNIGTTKPPSTPTSSVPEMDIKSAPLAGFLLTGLVLAGYERRRRIKLQKP